MRSVVIIVVVAGCAPPGVAVVAAAVAAASLSVVAVAVAVVLHSGRSWMAEQRHLSGVVVVKRAPRAIPPLSDLNRTH